MKCRLRRDWCRLSIMLDVQSCIRGPLTILGNFILEAIRKHGKGGSSLQGSSMLSWYDDYSACFLPLILDRCWNFLCMMNGRRFASLVLSILVAWWLISGKWRSFWPMSTEKDVMIKAMAALPLYELKPPKPKLEAGIPSCILFACCHHNCRVFIFLF